MKKIIIGVIVLSVLVLGFLVTRSHAGVVLENRVRLDVVEFDVDSSELRYKALGVLETEGPISPYIGVESFWNVDELDYTKSRPTVGFRAGQLDVSWFKEWQDDTNFSDSADVVRADLTFKFDLIK